MKMKMKTSFTMMVILGLQACGSYQTTTTRTNSERPESVYGTDDASYYDTKRQVQLANDDVENLKEVLGFDNDQDDKLTAQEFLEWFLANNKGAVEEHCEYVETLKCGKRVLSDEEIIKMGEEVLDSVDADGNGLIEQNELLSFVMGPDGDASGSSEAVDPKGFDDDESGSSEAVDPKRFDDDASGSSEAVNPRFDDESGSSEAMDPKRLDDDATGSSGAVDASGGEGSELKDLCYENETLSIEGDKVYCVSAQ